MRKLYLFNPDHDLALANFDPNYMPSANVRQLASDLALLPAWYAKPDDSVWAASAFNQAFLDNMKSDFPDLPSLCTATDIILFPSPWGWNPAVANRLSRSGISQENLPSKDQLLLIREYSHRKFAARLLPKLLFNHAFCGASSYLTDINLVRRFVEEHDKCILKAPLSGSGKGLNWCKGVFTYHIEHWCKNILKQQGGVVCEPQYNKTIDFAMQFKAEANKITFSGYSLFETNTSGAYGGNYLASNHQIEEELRKYTSLLNLELIKETLIRELNGLQDVYTGYFGVDMMICRFNEAPFYRIHPCVEINLRMNMGMTSRIIYDRYIHPGSKGMFRIDYYSSTEKLKQQTAELSNKNPLQLENGRIIKGYLPLVPVNPQSQYHAWVEIY